MPRRGPRTGTAVALKIRAAGRRVIGDGLFMDGIDVTGLYTPAEHHPPCLFRASLSRAFLQSSGAGDRGKNVYVACKSTRLGARPPKMKCDEADSWSAARLPLSRFDIPNKAEYPKRGRVSPPTDEPLTLPSTRAYNYSHRSDLPRFFNFL